MLSADAPMLLAVRARRLAGRRRWRRALSVVVVVLTCLVVAAQFRAAEAARQRWTDTRVVAVARRDLQPGDVVGDDAVRLREVAAASVAPAALDALPLGSVVRYPVVAGEAVVAARLAPDGLTGLAALVPAGQRAVALPVGPAARPPLRRGDRVDVLALVAPPDALVPAEFPADPSAPEELDRSVPAEGDPPERPAGAPVATTGVVPLVERALVVDVAAEAVTVAVPAALAPAVAAAVTQGAVVLALTGA